MNYFELYDIPVGFDIDKVLLRSKFLELSKRYHPDHHTLSDEDQQLEMLDRSSHNNKAFQTLSHEMSRIRHVLDIKGVIKDENDEKMSPDFLMEMMDLNEMLMEYEMNESDMGIKEEALKKIAEVGDTLRSEVASILALLDITDISMSDLEQVKAFYFKSKYINRLKEKLQA